MGLIDRGVSLSPSQRGIVLASAVVAVTAAITFIAIQYISIPWKGRQVLISNLHGHAFSIASGSVFAGSTLVAVTILGIRSFDTHNEAQKQKRKVTFQPSSQPTTATTSPQSTNGIISSNLRRSSSVASLASDGYRTPPERPENELEESDLNIAPPWTDFGTFIPDGGGEQPTLEAFKMHVATPCHKTLRALMGTLYTFKGIKLEAYEDAIKTLHAASVKAIQNFRSHFETGIVAELKHCVLLTLIKERQARDTAQGKVLYCLPEAKEIETLDQKFQEQIKSPDKLQELIRQALGAKRYPYLEAIEDSLEIEEIQTLSDLQRLDSRQANLDRFLLVASAQYRDLLLAPYHLAWAISHNRGYYATSKTAGLTLPRAIGNLHTVGIGYGIQQTLKSKVIPPLVNAHFLYHCPSLYTEELRQSLKGILRLALIPIAQIANGKVSKKAPLGETFDENNNTHYTYSGMNAWGQRLFEAIEAVHKERSNPYSAALALCQKMTET